MDDDDLVTIRSGGSPAPWLLLAVGGTIALAGGGGAGAAALSLRGELGLASLALVLAALPLAVALPIAVRLWRKHQRFLHILKHGQRVWGEVLHAERHMGRRRRRSEASELPNDGSLVNGSVQVRIRLSDGSLHIGTCKGWFRPGELDALAGGARAPVIYLPGVPEVIVANDSAQSPPT